MSSDENYTMATLMSLMATERTYGDLLDVFKQRGPAEMNEKIGQKLAILQDIADIKNASLWGYIVDVCDHLGIENVKELKDQPKCTTLPSPDPNDSSHGHSVASILGLGK